MGKLINRIPKPRDVNKRSQALPGKLDIKRHSPSILYVQYCSLQKQEHASSQSLLEHFHTFKNVHQLRKCSGLAQHYDISAILTFAF